MSISLIAAMGEHRVIGVKGQLPWHLPADLTHFRRITLDKPVVMGRRTFESIGHALPRRVNIVITTNATFRAPGCTVVSSLEAALQRAEANREMMVIGGASLYRQALPLAQRMYLTLVHHAFPGDTYFPEFCAAHWQVKERVDCLADAENLYPYSFVTLECAA